MNRLLTLIIYACFFYASSSNAVPLVKIIVSPCDYDKKEIFTSGFLGFTNPVDEPNYARLFLSLDDFKYNNFDQSIVVNLSDEIAKKREVFAKKYVNISGIYDCSIIKHANFGSGGFKSVTQIALGFENPDFDSNVFFSGKLKATQKAAVIEFGRNILKKIGEDLINKNKFRSLFLNKKIKTKKINRLNWIVGQNLPKKQIQTY
jgi:hypothetical protein